MSFSRIVLVMLAVVAVCGVLIAFVERPAYPRIVYKSDARVFYTPNEPTSAELEALTDSMVLGTPTPPHFVLTAMEGTITGTILGELAGPPPEY
jgi:hypothetical protein